LPINSRQKEKRLWTSNGQGDRLRLFEAVSGEEEALFVARELLHLLDRGFSLKDCAVLYRTNAQSRLLEEAMLYTGLAYRMVGGVRFYVVFQGRGWGHGVGLSQWGSQGHGRTRCRFQANTDSLLSWD